MKHTRAAAGGRAEGGGSERCRTIFWRVGVKDVGVHRHAAVLKGANVGVLASDDRRLEDLVS